MEVFFFFFVNSLYKMIQKKYINLFPYKFIYGWTTLFQILSGLAGTMVGEVINYLTGMVVRKI